VRQARRPAGRTAPNHSQPITTRAKTWRSPPLLQPGKFRIFYHAEEIVHKLEDMSIRLADSHAHLDLEDHFPIKLRCCAGPGAGVLLVINVATGLTDAPQVIATARTSPGSWRSSGFIPTAPAT